MEDRLKKVENTEVVIERMTEEEQQQQTAFLAAVTDAIRDGLSSEDSKKKREQEKKEEEQLVKSYESRFSGMEMGDVNKHIRAAKKARWDKMDGWQKAAHVTTQALPYVLVGAAGVTAGYALAGGFSAEAGAEGLEGLEGADGLDNVIAMNG